MPPLRYAKQNRITLRQVVQGSRQHAELLRMVEVPVIETDEGTRGGPFEGCYLLPKASTDEELPLSQLLARWTLDSRLSELGGDSMNPAMLHWLGKKKKNDLILMIMDLHKANMKLAKVLKSHAGILEGIHEEGEE